MQIKIVSMLVALILLSVVPLNVAADENDDIPTNAMSTGVHDSLVAALTHADLVTTLQGDGPFTVFAPTDDAFTAAGIDLSTFDTDEENATLVDILLYHVYSGAVNAADVTDGLTVTMVNGDEASFTVTNGTVMVGDATVTTADVASSNGIIHVIDKVLMPPADLTPQGEICYNMVTHTIVPGSNATECESYMYLEDYEMNGQNVTGCYNSVTHQVSNVSQAICEDYMWTPAVDIAMTAMATGIHSSLVAALTKADLVTTLQGDGPFTVFAPTDQAFTDAGIDLDSFTTDEDIATLTDILLYHVYSGAVNAADVTDGLTVTMVNGDEASFTVTAEAVMVGDATVTLADVPASNGVIHVIDKVLMPPVDLVDIPTVADGTGIHTALVAALTKANLVSTLQGDGPFTVFAPTDQAFTDAGIDLDSFTTDEDIATLTDILLYHVYSGAVNAADVTDGLTVTMVNGDEASFTVADGTVMVGGATVTIADVAASNGVIHVIDKVLMPPVDVVCDVTIGISPTGYAFSPSVVAIEVGQTVCWSWSDAEMGHNIKEVDEYKSSKFVENGITSGVSNITVEFHHTFTDNTTFNYACEPHISLDMFGKVIVGDGGIEPMDETDNRKSKSTPGFLGATMLLATLGAVLYSGTKRSEEL
jgi:uncharacterized surface protein with fasciclin (FAS1) repeats